MSTIETQIHDFLLNELVTANGTRALGPDDSLFQSGLIDSMAALKIVAFCDQNLGAEEQPGSRPVGRRGRSGIRHRRRQHEGLAAAIRQVEILAADTAQRGFDPETLAEDKTG